MRYFIPVILGTAREGRRSEYAARFIVEELKKREGIETELVDVRDHLFVRTARFDEEKNLAASAWHDIASRAHAFVIVSPEYNHGYPGELKLFLDALFDEYARKPVAIVGVGSGVIGGARAVESLRLVAIHLGLIPIRQMLYFSNIEKTFDANGALTDSAYGKRTDALIDALLAYLPQPSRG